MNRQLHFAQNFENAKQSEKQIAQIFDNHLNYFKVQLHSFTKKTTQNEFFYQVKIRIKNCADDFSEYFRQKRKFDHFSD